MGDRSWRCSWSEELGIAEDAVGGRISMLCGEGALLLALVLKSCGPGGAADQRSSVCVVFVFKTWRKNGNFLIV